MCFSSSEASPPESIYLSFTLFHFDARTTPRALLLPPEEAQAAAARANAVASGGEASGRRGGRGMGGGGGSIEPRSDAIVVEVKELSLGSQKRDAPYATTPTEQRGPWRHFAARSDGPCGSLCSAL